MYHQFNSQQFYVLPHRVLFGFSWFLGKTAIITYILRTQCIHVFFVDLRISGHYFPIQNQLTGFYNRYLIHLKPSGHYMYHQSNNQQFYVLPTGYLWGLVESEY